MCGICGEIRFDGAIADAARVARMTASMAPRGPDGAGISVRQRVGLGHRRLKIIDLSDHAAQPMHDPHLGMSIVFNGCIYNYPTLRESLLAKGHRFFSQGDTEVVLRAWAEWGPRCVERFAGMFAFAIHEYDSGRVYLVRDRFGIKPLYYAHVPGALRFASTLPALLAAGEVDTAIDPVALHHYLSWHAVVPAPRTILAGVRKLPAATIRCIETDGAYKDTVYWQARLEKAASEANLSAEDWGERLLASLQLAVRRRMVAAVPVGVLLSGGLDSSLITGLLAAAGQKELATFSIGFEAANGEQGDEFVYSDFIAKHYGTKHTKIFIEAKEMMANLPGSIRAMSEPMVSYDNIGFYLLSREVSKHIKVVQSGQGADEVFGGYHWYPPMVGSANPVATYRQAFFDRSHQALNSQIGAAFRLDADPSEALVAAHFAQAGASDPVDQALRLDTNVMLVDDPVKRVDCHSMAWGLEARVPFLDHDLVELAGRMPAALKLMHGGKGILKDVARKVIPAQVIDRPKGYFPVPALKYIEGPYLEMVRGALDSRVARERGLFERGYLEQLYAAPSDFITPLRGSELWQVALLEMWLQTQEI